MAQTVFGFVVIAAILAFLAANWKMMVSIGLTVGVFYAVNVLVGGQTQTSTSKIFIGGIIGLICLYTLFFRLKHKGDSTNRDRHDIGQTLAFGMLITFLLVAVYLFLKQAGFDIFFEISKAIKGMGR